MSNRLALLPRAVLRFSRSTTVKRVSAFSQFYPAFAVGFATKTKPSKPKTPTRTSRSTSRSSSPARSKTRSASPAARSKTRSASPAARSKTRSASPAARSKTRSASPARRAQSAAARERKAAQLQQRRERLAAQRERRLEREAALKEKRAEARGRKKEQRALRLEKQQQLRAEQREKLKQRRDAKAAKEEAIREHNANVKKLIASSPARRHSAYIFFFRENYPKVAAEVDKSLPAKERTPLIAKKISELWKALDASGKQPYIDKAEQDKKRYQEEQAKWNAEHAPPKRPASPYIRWATTVGRPRVLAEDPKLGLKEVGKKLGEQWKGVANTEKAALKQAYDKDLESFRKNMEKWRKQHGIAK